MPRAAAQADGRGMGEAGGAAGSADDEAAAEALRALCNLCQAFSASQQGLAPGLRRHEKRHEKADWAVAAGVVRPLIRIAETRPALADLVRATTIDPSRTLRFFACPRSASILF